MISAGTYRARVTGECVLGESKQKSTPFIEFYLTIIEGDSKGSRARWTGYFTENTNERSIQSLQTCGWQGDDLSEFSDGGLHGLDANEVEIVVELEEYVDKEGNPKTAPRVAWINRPGGFLNVDAAMAKDKAAAFGDRMRGLVLKTKEKNPPPKGGYKFGAATPNSSEAPASNADSDPIPF